MIRGRYAVVRHWGTGSLKRVGKASTVRRAKRVAYLEMRSHGTHVRASSVACSIVLSKDIHGPEVASTEREYEAARAWAYRQEQIRNDRGW